MCQYGVDGFNAYSNVCFLEDRDKNLLTSLGSGTDSEEDENDDKPMFGDGADDDFYEQLVTITRIKKLIIFILCLYVYFLKEINADDEKALEMFMSKKPEARLTLADMIMEKITEKQTEIQTQFTDAESMYSI